jgi:hypothetical protein
MNEGSAADPSSFRDPSGYLFHRGAELYRQVNRRYQENYDLLTSSGLYDKLVAEGLLVPHEEVDLEPLDAATAYKTIKPLLVPFVSYPYEWCFSQLKDAALATLAIQKTAMSHGMSLKDASAYNIQFIDCRPVLIDTLSFERYVPGRPWIAYRQFCQHFLAPLALMSYRDPRVSQLLKAGLDGIPLDLASKLLPARSKFRFSLLSHIHLNARSLERYSKKPVQVETAGTFSENAFRGLIESLEGAVTRLKLGKKETEWAAYYQETNYDEESFRQKEDMVRELVARLEPLKVWDLGANMGLFSRIVSDKADITLSIDSDHSCVERNYLECRETGRKGILPLMIDLTNPTPGIGWRNMERKSLVERGPADVALALALIHHLAISNNVPFDRLADFFADMCNALVIEFIPKDDSKVQWLLSSREDIFDDYTQKEFEKQFSRRFDITDSRAISSTRRTMYLMEKRAT